MKKEYLDPQMTITMFAIQDVVTLSSDIEEETTDERDPGVGGLPIIP